jgi:hypothetical protein
LGIFLFYLVSGAIRIAPETILNGVKDLVSQAQACALRSFGLGLRIVFVACDKNYVEAPSLVVVGGAL